MQPRHYFSQINFTFMKARFLLSHPFKRIGWVVFIPALIFGICVQHFELEIPGFEFTRLLMVTDNGIIVDGKPIANNLTNELAGLLVLVSGFMVAFSKEKIEDEWVSQVRLESLQWSVYLNYALLLITLLAVYDSQFFLVLIYNIFTILFFFIARFNYVLYIKDKIFHQAETV